MKALVVAPQPFFSPRGTPFSVYYRTAVMVEQGVEIDLLTYGEGQDVSIPRTRIIRIPRLRFLEPVRVGPSFAKLVLDILMMIWMLALLIRNRYHFVHAHEEAAFMCLLLRPVFRFKFVYDMHSSLPQQLINFRFTKSRLLLWAFGKLEKMSVRQADAVITICPDLAAYALSLSVAPSRHFLIENSIFDDVNLARKQQVSEDRGSIRKEAVSQGAPCVAYAGTLEPYQGVDLLIKAFAKVHQARPEARLLIIGGASDQIDSLRPLARDCGIDHATTFTGRVSKRVARDCLESATVLVSPRLNGTNTPLKIYEYLASGKPLVATNIRSHTQVLDRRVCFLVDPTPTSITQGILAALNDRAKRDEVVKAARDLFETKYSRSNYIERVRQLIEVLR